MKSHGGYEISSFVESLDSSGYKIPIHLHNGANTEQ